MKRIALLMSLIVCAFALNAQDIVFTQVDTNKMSKIVFEKTVHDYGTIARGSKGTCKFIFSNKGKVPLLLSAVKASCGCTTPAWSKEPVAPGKTGEITVRYNTDIPGKFSKSVTVSSNAVNPTMVLQIKGEVK
ncbi:MAG: DUF1573 domain-containing protein [Bacteroidota bacterium]